jgi:uncharacterized protein involved in exopolysaccharide biosynthesis
MKDDQNTPLAYGDLKGPPQGYFVVVPPRIEEDFVDIKRMLLAVSGRWKSVLLIGLVVAAVSAIVSLQMPNIFRAEVLLAPAQQQTGAASNLRSQFGGLAALAGIDLGSTASDKEEALATLRSPGFARDFIRKHNLMPVLFKDEWNPQSNTWRNGQPPSLEMATKRFMTDVRMITEDKKTNLITVAVEWRTPKLAADWANSMVAMVNERLRHEAIDRSKRSVAYLNGELQRTDSVNLREPIYRLIEAQINSAMLANVQRDYAFKVIDPAVVPEVRIRPRRAVLTVAGFAIGLLIGAFVAVMRAGSAKID